MLAANSLNGGEDHRPTTCCHAAGLPRKLSQLVAIEPPWRLGQSPLPLACANYSHDLRLQRRLADWILDSLPLRTAAAPTAFAVERWTPAP